jgi:hypothetical protein
MEREYVFWRTGTGCAVFMIGMLVAPLALLAIWAWVPHSAATFVAIWGAVFAPILWLSNRVDRRRARRIAGRPLASTPRRVIRAIVATASLVVAVLLVDLSLGTLAMHRWYVPVTVRVVDAATGDPVPDVRVRFGTSHLFAVDDLRQSDDAVHFGVIIRRCYGRGRFFVRRGIFARTVPEVGNYLFVFEADGYQSATVAASQHRLTATPAEAGRIELAYALPTVPLQRDFPVGTSH